MLIRFLKHSTGSGTHAINYLLGEKDHKGQERAGVRVVRGDTYLVGALIDSLETIHRYSSAVIAFHPDDKPSDFDIENVLTDFEKVCFAGLGGNQYCWCAVEHLEEDGSKHIHIVVPRVELTTGKAFNVAPPGHEYFFDKWRDSWNSEKGWRSPKDPAIARDMEKANEALPNLSEARLSKTEVQSKVTDALKAGQLKNRAELVEYLNSQGEVTRAGTDYISFKPAGAERAIRLKGAFFAEDWVYVPSEKIKALEPDLMAAQHYREKLQAQVDKRVAYNLKRYLKPVSVKTEATIEQDIIDEATADSYSADVAEAIERAEQVNRFASEINQEVESSIASAGNQQFTARAKRSVEETQRTIEFAEQRINEADRAVEKFKQGLSFFDRTIRVAKKLISSIKAEVKSKVLQKQANLVMLKMNDEQRNMAVTESIMRNYNLSFSDAYGRAEMLISSGVVEYIEEYKSLLLENVLDDIYHEQRVAHDRYQLEKIQVQEKDDDSPSFTP